MTFKWPTDNWKTAQPGYKDERKTKQNCNIILQSSACVYIWGFPHSSDGEESACNAGDPSSIPGLGRSPGEGIEYPIRYSWTSLVAQLVKTLPAVWEIWI